MRRRALGIDFGARNLKCVLLSQAGSSVVVEAVKSVPLEPGLVADGVIVDRRSLARTLRCALSDAHAGGIATAVSVPTQHATLKWINLPSSTPEDLRRTAAKKVASHLPYSIEGAYLLTSPAEDGESLVISVPRQVIASRAIAVERAGLRPVSAELEGQALLRILERGLRQRSALVRDASMTIIDIGGASTVMYVVQNRKLQFIRSVRFGIGRIAARLATELGIEESAAQSLLANPRASIEPGGVLSVPSGGKTLKVDIGRELDVLLKEIGRLMRYFRSLHAERSYAGILDHMMLCGGFANVAGLSDYLSEQLRVRIAPLEPFRGMTFNVDDEAFQLASHSPNSFAIAAGLALSPLDVTERTGKEEHHDDFVWARSA